MSRIFVSILAIIVVFCLGMTVGQRWSERPPRDVIFSAPRERGLDTPGMPADHVGDMRRESQSWDSTPFRNALAFQAALSEAEALTRFSERSAHLGKLLSIWALIDPQEAAAYLEQIKSPSLLSEILPGLVTGWARHDPHEAARWVQDNVRGEAQLRAATSLTSEWVRTDPEKALEWVTSQREGHLKSAATKSLFRAWGTRFPEDALAALPDRGHAESDQLVAEILIGAADNDLGLSQKIATREITRQPDANFLNEFVAATGFIDPPGTIDFLNRLPASVDISESLSAAASYAADARPDEALDWAFSQPPECKERSAIISSVAVTLALNDPEIAMNRVEVLPATPDADTYVANAVAILAAEHPDQTNVWIRTELKGARKDAAVTAFFCGDQRQSFTADTASLATEIQDHDLMMKVMGGYLNRTAEGMPRHEVQQQLRLAGVSHADIDLLLPTP